MKLGNYFIVASAVATTSIVEVTATGGGNDNDNRPPPGGIGSCGGYSEHWCDKMDECEWDDYYEQCYNVPGYHHPYYYYGDGCSVMGKNLCKAHNDYCKWDNQAKYCFDKYYYDWPYYGHPYYGECSDIKKRNLCKKHKGICKWNSYYGKCLDKKTTYPYDKCTGYNKNKCSYHAVYCKWLGNNKGCVEKDTPDVVHCDKYDKQDCKKAAHCKWINRKSWWGTDYCTKRKNYLR